MLKKSPISHAVKWSSSFLALSLILTSGCGFMQTQSPKEPLGPKEKVYFGKYDRVWRATQLALASYPIKVNNMDLGIIETDIIKVNRSGHRLMILRKIQQEFNTPWPSE